MGPCLCGDIYCQYCGNPAAAEMADSAVAASDRLIELCRDKSEVEFALDLVAAVLPLRRQLQTVPGLNVTFNLAVHSPASDASRENQAQERHRCREIEQLLATSSDADRKLLRLVSREKDVKDGWRYVSAILAADLEDAARRDWFEYDDLNRRIRLTDAGREAYKTLFGEQS